MDYEAKARASLSIGYDEALKKLPVHCQNGVDKYIVAGYGVGGFLRAIFSNDLKNAVGRADSSNLKAIVDYVDFLYNFAPSQCWGSEKNHVEWVKAGGLAGLIKKNEEGSK